MEVIKKGNKNYIYYVRCEKCGSIISFMEPELDWSHRLVCPICKSSVYTDVYLHENDPYLGDDELKKEVEEYLANKEKTEAPNLKPVYVPNSKKEDEVTDKPKSMLPAEEIKGILEELLREVRVESDKVVYIPYVYYEKPPTKEDVPTRGFEPPYEYRPYVPSKTTDWPNPYCSILDDNGRTLDDI